MIRLRLLLATVLCMALLLPVLFFAAEKDQAKPPRPIELADIMGWKAIRPAVLSNDGQWLAYRIAPREGDGDVVIRRIREGQELRFPAGEVPTPAAGVGGGRGGQAPAASREIAFSEDSKWVLFTVYPPALESRRQRGGGSSQTPSPSPSPSPGPAPGPAVAAGGSSRTTYNKVSLVNLGTEKKLDYDKIKRASFSGENPNWLALHRYPGENQGRDKDRWTGSDLILRDLNAGIDQNIGNVSEFSFDRKGRWLAWVVDAQEKAANGVQLRNMSNGVILPLDSDKASYKGLSWTEQGDGLAALKGVDDPGYEDKLYSLLGFTGFTTASAPEKILYDPKADSSFPAGMSISPNRNPVFMEDRSGILFGICEVRKKKATPAGRRDAEGESATAARTDAPGQEVGPPGRNRPGSDAPAEREKPDLVVWHWLDKRLQSQQQVEETRDRNFSYLCIYRIAEKKFLRLADDAMRQVVAGAEARFGVGLDDNEYQLMGSLDGRRYQDVYAVDLRTGQRQLAVKKARWYQSPSPDGTHILYYDDGNYFTFDMASGQSYNITKTVPTSFVDGEDDHNVAKPPVRPIGWVTGSASVLLSDGWDLWIVPVHGGQAVNLTVNGKKDRLRYRNYLRVDTEERDKGIDLSGAAYFGVQAEDTKKSGIARLDGGKAGARMLLRDDAQFGGLMKAKKADTFLMTRENYRDFPDFYLTDSALQNLQRITEANPQQKDFLWSSGLRLVGYTSAKGDKLQASLFLPANYQEGKSYPTIVYIYEKLTQGHNSYGVPTANGFNKTVYTSNGYAVLMPDIVYRVNDPGMSAVWCVVPAVQAAIATGVVDAKRVGIHGHSWGGYQTSFLITQTDIFRAAIAGAPLTNMISMYSSIYWNTGGGDMAIFESSQGRFLGGYWDNLEAYQRNSPVYHARNVKTPLMILHNDRDGAVDFNQGIEYYNTLRRMQKPVVMLQYRGENHGLRIPANMKDYTVRMKEFFDHHLMGKPAPAWLTEGVPLIKIKEHIDERTQEKPKEPAKEKPVTPVP